MATTKLKGKQELFCQEYIKDLNGSRAYAAVYKTENENTARAAAARLIANVSIRARIDELMAVRVEEMKVDQNWVILRLMQISDRCMQQEPVMKWDYEQKALVETGEYTFDSTGANRATELLGKHMGMFTDKVQHSGEVNNTGMNSEQFAEVLEQVRKNAQPPSDKSK